MDRRRWIPALLLACVWVIGCGTKQQAVKTPPPEVEAAMPLTKQVTDYEYFTGRTEAVSSIDVRARVTGYLDEVRFKEGSDVKENEVLAIIDPRTYKAELARAEADLEKTGTHRNRLELDFQRAETLLPKNAISREDYDKIVGDRNEATAAVQYSKANLDVAKLNLSFTTVRSPINGRISRRAVDPGNLVKADDTVLTTIVSLNPMYASFYVDERTLLRVRRLIREGKAQSARDVVMPVEMGLADETGYRHRGTINFVDNQVDPQTGTLRIRGVFENVQGLAAHAAFLGGAALRAPDVIEKLQGFISPGLFARVRVPVGRQRPALVIAEGALGTDQGKKYVYVLNQRMKNGQGEEMVNDDGKPLYQVEYRDVAIGSLTEGGLRVIEKGLGPNDYVVINGLQRIRPGIPAVRDEKPMPVASDLPATNFSTNANPK